MKKVIFYLFVLQAGVCAHMGDHHIDHHQRLAAVCSLTAKSFKMASYCSLDRSKLDEPKRIQCNALDQIEENRKALRLLAGCDHALHGKSNMKL